MFQQLLVALDGSESSVKAADAAIELAVLLRAKLDVLSVEETLPRYVATQEESTREHSAAVTYFARLQNPIRQRAQQRGVQVRCAVLSGHEGQVILDYIREQRCDLLVLGYQGHSGVWGAFLGSTADKLVSHAPCSVLVTRPKMGKSLFRRATTRVAPMINGYDEHHSIVGATLVVARLMVALDGSPLSWQAFQVGLQLAKILGASLSAISVIERSVAPSIESASTTMTTTVSEGIRWNWTTYFQQVQDLATTQAQLAGLTLETITREGYASGVLTAAAQAGSYDLLVLGATGNEHPLSPTTGGTARKVANEAPCAVLLVRPPASQYRVRDLMISEVAAVNQQTPVSEVISQLVEHGVKLLAVVDEEQHVLGVVTLGHLLTHGESFHRFDLQWAVTTTHLSQHVDQIFPTERTAADVMIRHPLIVKDDTSIEAAARWMISQHVTRMPAVDADEKLIGLLDQAALLHFYAGLPEASESLPAEELVQQGGHPRIVGEAVLSQVPLVAPGTPFPEVLRRVQETPLRRVIVVNPDGKALGVIGDRDLLVSQGLVSRRNPILALAGRLSLLLPEDLFRGRLTQGPLTAQQMMRPHLFAVTPATPVAEAVRIMLAHQIKRLVVVDEAGKPLGLVDRQQLLRSLVEGGAGSDLEQRESS
jgi:nucleotide-binding universal stress UspA family protein/predicted transcriptional regulator